jgi:hypothetical protein
MCACKKTGGKDAALLMSNTADKKSRNRPTRVIEAAAKMDETMTAKAVEAADLLANYQQAEGRWLNYSEKIARGDRITQSYLARYMWFNLAA